VDTRPVGIGLVETGQDKDRWTARICQNFLRKPGWKLHLYFMNILTVIEVTVNYFLIPLLACCFYIFNRFLYRRVHGHLNFLKVVYAVL